jgi:TolB-like protein
MSWSLLVPILLCPALAAADGESAPGSADEPTKVAVLALKATGLDEDVATNLTELFTSEAGEVPGFEIISQSEIKEMLSFEQQRQMLGCDDESCVAELGGALGVARMITGTVGKVGDTFVVNIKLIDSVKAQPIARIGETVPGRLELLPPTIRVAAWQLLGQDVPAHVQADYDATEARLAEEDARASGDAAALAEAERVRAEAEKAKAEADKTRAQTERLRLERENERARAEQAAALTAPAAPPAPRRAWAKVGRNVATIVAGVGLVGGGTAHALSFMKAREVGDAQEARAPDVLDVYEGKQADADAAVSLRKWAYVGYAVGGVGVAAALVFGWLKPEEPDPTAVRVVPAAHGVAVVF